MFTQFCSMGIFVMAVAVLVFIAWADRRTMEIPDGCHLVLIGLGLLQMLCGSGLPFGARILGLFIVALPMLLAELIRKDSFGGGDIKMCGSVGFLLGSTQVLTGSLLALILAGLFGAASLLVGHKKPKDTFPLGPFLSFGFIVVMVAERVGVSMA